jgi:heme/copper-type cytochrome/quinol oxidase subunit 2
VLCLKEPVLSSYQLYRWRPSDAETAPDHEAQVPQSIIIITVVVVAVIIIIIIIIVVVVVVVESLPCDSSITIGTEQRYALFVRQLLWHVFRTGRSK